jgi:hypothetical protein
MQKAISILKQQMIEENIYMTEALVHKSLLSEVITAYYVTDAMAPKKSNIS